MPNRIKMMDAENFSSSRLLDQKLVKPSYLLSNLKFKPSYFQDREMEKNLNIHVPVALRINGIRSFLKK